MIELKNIHYNIGGNNVLDNMNWCVKNAQHTLIIGASGSGKTTLLHLLAGLLMPSSGAINIDEQDLAALSGSARDGWRGRTMGMVFQTLHLVKALTVRDNLRLARRMANLPADNARVEMLLSNVGLSGKASQYPHQLSLGQAQRVAIARAVVNQPKWILADEPTSALDDAHCSETLDLLEAQAKECGSTLIIATHDQRIKSRYHHTLELYPFARKAS